MEAISFAGPDGITHVLSYHAVDMGVIREAVRKWEQENPPPVVPVKRRRWTGVDTAEWVRVSLERYGVQRHPDVRAEMEAAFEDVPAPTDPDYLADLAAWKDRRAACEMAHLISHGCPDGQGAALTACLSQTGGWAVLRQAIIGASELTDEVMSAAVIALNRFFRGKPLVDKWADYCERHGLTTQYEQADDWSNRARDYLIQEGQLPYIRVYEQLPVKQQAVELAWVITNRIMRTLSSETEQTFGQLRATRQNG
jgi:hypothetical protein